MAERDKERYFWLKLHRDFFKRHDMRILEGMAEGREFVLLYLKLMVESIDHEGELRFSEAIPYTPEMLACLTNTEAETVRRALQAFEELGLMETGEDGTLFFPAVAKLLGSETAAAKRKREYRRAAFSPCPEQISPETENGLEEETGEEGSAGPDSARCRAKDVQRIIEAWNSLGLGQLVRVTADSRRGMMLRARINEYGTDAVLQGIEKIRNSDFLKGRNAKNWVVTFDWFVKPNNFPKVLEGNYDDSRTPAEKKTSNPFLAMLLEENDD